MFGKSKKNKKGIAISNRLEILNSVLGQSNIKDGNGEEYNKEGVERLAEAVGDKDWQEELEL